MPENLIYAELTYDLNGIFFTAHNELGRFCNERQYGDALERRLRERNIPYERERVLAPMFEGERPGRNRVDFLIADAIIVEVKAKRIIQRSDYDQLLRYLSALDCKLGIIVNFRQYVLAPKRVINPAASIRDIRVSTSFAPVNPRHP